MHHFPQNQERAINLSILLVSGPGEFSGVESNWAAGSTPGGALPSIPLSFSLATILPPKSKYLWFLTECPEGHPCNATGSSVDIVYGWDYDGIWSSSIPQLSFLINENILAECFRISSSWVNPRISPLTTQYERPQLSLSIITLALETNKIRPMSYSIIPCCNIQWLTPALNTLIFSK